MSVGAGGGAPVEADQVEAYARSLADARLADLRVEQFNRMGVFLTVLGFLLSLSSV